VKNEVLQRVEELKNILHAVKLMKGNWIDHILRRNCLQKRILGGKVEWRETKKKTLAATGWP
jgi:hypothetical protein